MPEVSVPGAGDELSPGSESAERLALIRARAEAARRRAAAMRLRAEDVRRQVLELEDRHSALTAGTPGPPTGRLEDGGMAGERMSRLRSRAADISDRLAEAAETFAAYLEDAAHRGDRVHRLEVAAVEREIAAIERRNAARLRQGGAGLAGLESIPDLPIRRAGEPVCG